MHAHVYLKGLPTPVILDQARGGALNCKVRDAKMWTLLPEGLARNGGYQAIDLDAGSILSPSAEGSGSVWGSVILGVKSAKRTLGHSGKVLRSGRLSCVFL